MTEATPATRRDRPEDYKIVSAATAEKSAVCESILRALPDWFAIESSIRRYVGEAANLPMWIARRGGDRIGFLTLQPQTSHCAELHLVGVRPDWHRRGVGSALLRAAEASLVAEGIAYLAVKTLSAAADYAPYRGTRAFYEALGFRPILELPTLWSADNPCLVMLKPLQSGPSRRRLVEPRLVVASHNAGKLREIRALLAPLEIDVVAASTLGLVEPKETEPTFTANAVLKARAAARAAHLPALADDSGLVVEALAGAPGIHSARWAGAAKDFGQAMARVEAALRQAGSDDRRAHFVCALALCWPGGHCETFEGRVRGSLVWPPRGDKGFGYDPMFVPDGSDRTFGEMDAAEKDGISHRADAFRQLAAACLAR